LQTLGKAVNSSGTAGEPLPAIYDSFERNRILFRRGASSMIAGWPGSYKSALALNHVVGWCQAGLHGFYVSADDDAIGNGGRIGAILSGYPVDAVETGLREGSSFYTRTLEPVKNCKFIFNATDVEEVDRLMRGYEALYGAWPDFVVVDNLMNVADSTDDFGPMRDMTRDLALIARDTRTHFMILHHTSESYGQVGAPPPRAALMGKLSQFPQLVLTVGAEHDKLNVCAVKNRHGSQDPSGQTMIPFQVFPDTMRVREMWSEDQLKIGA
jgi:AAA domain-containing protein